MIWDIFLSRFHEEAFSAIIEKLKRVDPLDLDAGHVVIVPDRYTLSIEKLVYSSLPQKASFNISVLTLSRLAASLFPSGRFLSRQAAVMLTKKAIGRVAGGIKCFEKSIKFAGFAQNMYREICRFKSALVSPDSLMALSKEASGEVSARLHDIALIYGEYEKLLEGRYTDTQGLLRIMAEGAAESPFIKNSRFYIAGYDELSRAEYSCLKAVAAACRGICFAAVEEGELLSDIRQMARELGAKLAVKGIPHRRSESRGLIYKYIDEYGYRDGADCPDIKVIPYKDILEETEGVAQSITERVRSGMRFKDILVVLCGISNYLYPLEKVFKRYGIPYYISEGKFLSDEPLFKAFACLLSAAEKCCEQADVLAFVKSPFFGSPEEDIELFENYCLKFGIDKGRFLHPFELSDGEEELLAAERVRQKFIKYYDILAGRRKEGVEEMISAARQALALFGDAAPQRKALSEGGYMDEAMYRGQAGEKLEKLFDDLEEILCGEKVSLKEFKDILIAGAESVKLSLVPISCDVVTCGGPEVARFCGAKAVYVLGAVEGEFPSSTFPHPLVSSADVKHLPGLDRLEGDLGLLIERRHGAVKRLLCFDGELEISYYLNKSEKPCQPSDYVRRLEQLLKVEKRQGKRLPIERERIILPPVGKLESAPGLYFAGVKASVSAIESYFKCPRRFLYSYGYFAKKRKDCTFRSLDKGNFIHSAVELFIKKLIGGFPPGASVEEVAAECFEEVFSADEYKRFMGSAREIAAFYKLKGEIIRACGQIMRQIEGSDFFPICAEAEFDEKGMFPPIELNLKGRRLLLKGKIDRVDVCEKGGRKFVRIIDYKSGSVDYLRKHLYFGEKVQLYIYMNALKERFEPAGVYYLPITSRFSDQGERRYRLLGATVLDEEIIRASDKKLEVGGESELLELKLSADKSGAIKPGVNLERKEIFDSYLKYSILLCQKAVEEILQGFCGVAPCEGACSYCDFSEVCARDLANAVFRRLSAGRGVEEKIAEAVNGA